MASLSLIDTAAAFPGEAREEMRIRASMARTVGMAAVLPSTQSRWFTDTTVERRPDLIDRVSRTLLADDAAVHAAMWDVIAAVDLVPGLPRIAARTLVLVGEHDPSSPVAAARVLQENIVGAELHVIVGSSHMAPLERSDVVNDHLARILAG